MGNPVNTGLVLGSQSNVETYDYSRAFGGTADYSEGGIGSKIFAGDASGAVINITDPGAILAGRDVALQALDSNERILQRVAGSADSAVQKVLDLMGVREQGDLGTLLRSALWLVGIVVAGAVAWAYFKKPKAEKEAP